MKISLEALLAHAVADSPNGRAAFTLGVMRHPRTRTLEFTLQQLDREEPAGQFMVTGTIVTALDRKAGTDG